MSVNRCKAKDLPKWRSLASIEYRENLDAGPLEKVSTFRPCRYLVEDPSAQSVRNQAATYETLLIRTFFRRSPTLVCSSTCVALSTRQDTNHMRDRIDHHPPVLDG